MISIEINDRIDQNHKLLDPIDIYGADYGNVYRMYCAGEPSDTYFIGTGKNDRPICIWFDDIEEEWRLSSDSKKDLKGFCPEVKVKFCPYAKVTITLEV